MLVLLLDTDGPSLEIYPEGVIITADVFREALNDERRIFGHAFVIGALLAGVDVIAVCSEELEPAMKKQRM
jgi:hypothetical protein